MRKRLGAAIVCMALVLGGCVGSDAVVPAPVEPSPADESHVSAEHEDEEPESLQSRSTGDPRAFFEALCIPNIDQQPRRLGNAFIESYNALAAEYGMDSLKPEDLQFFEQDPWGTGLLLLEGINECQHFQLSPMPSGLVFNIYVEYRKVEFFGTVEDMGKAKGEVATVLATFYCDLSADEIRTLTDSWFEEAEEEEAYRKSFYDQGIITLLTIGDDYVNLSVIHTQAVLDAWPEKSALREALHQFNWCEVPLDIDWYGQSCNISLIDWGRDGTPEIVASYTNINDYSSYTVSLKLQEDAIVPYASFPGNVSSDGLPPFDGSPARGGIPFYQNPSGEPVLLLSITPHHNSFDATHILEISLEDLSPRLLFKRHTAYGSWAGPETSFYTHDSLNYPFTLDMLEPAWQTSPELGYISLTEEQYRTQFLDYLKNTPEIGAISSSSLFGYDTYATSHVAGHYWTDLEDKSLKEEEINDLIATLVFLPCAMRDVYSDSE